MSTRRRRRAEARALARTARCSILALGALAYALAQTMIVPALPEIQRELGASAATSPGC